jgi:hypothetical protein
MKLNDLFPTKHKIFPSPEVKLARKREKQSKAEEEAQGPARLHAMLTGEGLEVLGCEVCGCPLRFKECLNPGCRHINPRAPEFIPQP